VNVYDHVQDSLTGHLPHISYLYRNIIRNSNFIEKKSRKSFAHKVF